MLLMSSPGEMTENENTADLKKKMQRSMQDLCNERVIQNDVRQLNIL